MPVSVPSQPDLRHFPADKKNPAWERFAAAALFLLYLVFLNPHIDFTEFNANDPSAYLGRAVSILQGKGYGEIYADVFHPVTLQPPAFSFLLAQVIRVWGMNFTVLKLTMTALALILALQLFRFFKTFLPSSAFALPLTLLVMAHPAVFGLSHRVLAEIPLMSAMIAGLVFMENYLKRSGVWVSKELAAAVLVISIGYFFKETALTVLLGAGLIFLHPRYFKKEIFFKLMLTAACVALPVWFWKAYCDQIPQTGFWAQSGAINFTLKNPYELGDTTAMTLTDFLVRVRRNVAWGMAANCGMLAVPFFYFSQGSLLSFLLSLPILAWLAFQMVRSWLKEPTVLEGFVLVTLLMLLPKIEGMALRYVVPLYPAFLIYAVRAFQSESGRIRQTGKFLFALLFAAALGATVLAAVNQARNPYGTPLAADFAAAAKQAADKFPAKSLCLSPMESQWQVLTNHLCYIQKTPEAAANAAYALVLTEDALQNPVNQTLKDFPATLFKEARAIRGQVSALPFETVYRNDSFEIRRFTGAPA